MARSIAVILSGCGYLDGAEIQESVLTLYFLDRAGARVDCYAPDRDQMHVMDHQNERETDGARNVLQESARISRGHVRALRELDLSAYDALVMPGGFGVAKNLSTFAVDGAEGSVEPDFQRAISQALELEKPIVAMCIAPAVLAMVLANLGKEATLTIGHDTGVAAAIEAKGCQHRPCDVQELVVDEKMRIVSTPAYMLDSGPAGVGAGIEAAISKLFTWI